MFELNLASLPNHILYLEGVQLSYIKVFVHIFNLWHSHKPCYLGNTELMERTKLARSTIQEALAFFEKHLVLKRVQKGRKRYLVQSSLYLEMESNQDDKPNKDSSNNDQAPELADRRARAGRHQGPELADHNNKYNNKYNKRESSLPVSACPKEKESILSEEAIKIIDEKNLNLKKTLSSFMNYAKANGWIKADWKAAFVKWVIDEKIHLVKINSSETTRPKYRDFTQERLDREKEMKGAQKSNRTNIT